MAGALSTAAGRDAVTRTSPFQETRSPARRAKRRAPSVAQEEEITMRTTLDANAPEAPAEDHQTPDTSSGAIPPKRPASRPRQGSTLARRADKYQLYEQAVQDPESQCDFYNRVFRREFRRPARSLLEDFCSTAALSFTWTRQHTRNSAIARDIDPAPLAWAEKHHRPALTGEERRRIELRQEDVRQEIRSRVDVISAENFSYFLLQSRDELKQYFSAAYCNLGTEGLLVTDILGGPLTYAEGHLETRRCRGFSYVWEQARFDPITRQATCYIHFRFRDGSQKRRAFSYRLRLWTIPEVREALREVGFRKADVYWEGTTRNGDGDGCYRRRERAESDPAWVAYIVGVK